MRSSMHAERAFSGAPLLWAALPIGVGALSLVGLGLGFDVESLVAAGAVSHVFIGVLLARVSLVVRSGHRDLDARLTEVVARELAGDAAFKRSVDALAADVANGIERPAGSLEERLRRRDA